MEAFSLLSTRNNNVITKWNLFRRESISIQYNIARIKSILEKFDNDHQEYHPLEQLKLNLLDNDFEWNLLFTYTNLFHQLDIPSSFFNEETESDLNYNKILITLYRFVRLFSCYYRNVKILINPMPHLEDLIQCRVYLCRNILQKIQYYFQLINVNIVDQM